MPSSAAGPFPRRASSPGAQPACLSITQPALPRPPPPPPPAQGSLQSCFSPPAPQALRGCGEESGAAPAVPLREGRAKVLNHRPDGLPGSAPQVARAKARTQPACCAAVLYLRPGSSRDLVDRNETRCCPPRRVGTGAHHFVRQLSGLQ